MGLDGGDFDVELVAVPASGKQAATAAAPAPGGLSRRDVLLFGFCGVGVLLAFVLGGVLASGGFGPLLRNFSGPPAATSSEETPNK
jgi:hypothetical protein